MNVKNPTENLYAEFFNFRPKKGDLRRISILESTLDCIASIGIENVSFESIGKRTGMRRAHVAYYFPDRADIIEAAIKFAIATAQNFTVEKVRSKESGEDKFRAFIEATFDWIDAYPKHAASVLLFYYYCSYQPKYRKLHTDARAIGAARVEAILLMLPGSPKKTNAQTLRLSSLVQSILTGNLIQYGTTDHKDELKSLRTKTAEDILKLVKCYLKG